MLDVRDVIFQSRNDAHDLLAFFLQATSFPLGHLKNILSIYHSICSELHNWKYLGRNTGGDELVSMLVG
jgi:hypothetical protein